MLELTPRPYDPLKSVYWGELHVHTTESLDAVLFGTTATIEDAYRFAQGNPLRSPGGELMQLSRPLDFVAITDHAEGFGLRSRCGDPYLNFTEQFNCLIMQTPGYTTAMFLRNRLTRMAVEPDPTQPAGVYRNRPRNNQPWDCVGICSADVMSAPLQRIQIIKDWIDIQGETHESVRDVVCANGLEVDPDTLRCPDNGASVDISSCQPRGEGAGQLMKAWQDEDFDASQNAFYYVRAIQNPTCRWSTYDAIRLGIEPDPRVPATIRERAWSSPIWIDPSR